jgi:Zn-dependent peptidase ImmA (M78 family)
MILKEIKYRNFKAKIVKLTRKQAKYGNMYGCYFPDTQTIAIQEKLSNYTLLDTMLHEIGHFIADKSKIRLANLGEEGITTFVGSEFAKVFMQNPKLITFIKRCTAK